MLCLELLLKFNKLLKKAPLKINCLQLNDDAIATFRRLVPTATLEDKCGAFVRQADDCQREQRKGASSGRKQKKVKVKREEEEEEGRVLEQPGQEETYEEAVRREKRKNPDEEFRRLCLKALDVFIVRSETVMVSNTFKVGLIFKFKKKMDNEKFVNLMVKNISIYC